MSMMNLSANMDLRNTKINCLAKANYGFEIICPPAKAGGNSNGGKTINRNGF